MSALDRVRKKYGNLPRGTDKTDKSPFGSSVGSSPKEAEKFFPCPADLERRIRLMAQRWQYTHAELLEVLDLASDDPGVWLRAVVLDERREQAFRDRGLQPRADA